MPVLVGSNSDEASVMAVFGVDLAGEIQKLRRERRLGLGLIKLLYPGVKGDEELGVKCAATWRLPRSATW